MQTASSLLAERPALRRGLVIGAVAVAVLPLAVGLVAVLARGEFAIHGDNALLELRVRDVGSLPFLAVDLRNSINEGLIPGPRIVASGPGIVQGGLRVERSRPHQQISVAGTIGKIMGFPTPRVDASGWALQEMFS